MKKILVSISFLIVFASCENSSVEKLTVKTIDNNLGHITNLRVIKIDNCEYLYGDWGNQTVLTHKGNCNNPIHSFKKQEQ